MEVKERLASHQSSAECSTATAEGYTASYIKRPSIRMPCRAIAVIQAFHTIKKLLQLKLAVTMFKSQVNHLE